MTDIPPTKLSQPSKIDENIDEITADITAGCEIDPIEMEEQ